MKYFILTILLFVFISCNQTKNNNKQRNKIDAISNKGVPKLKDTQSNIKEKYLTFNDPIDTLPKNLKLFIPKGYSAINVSTGDANLDGIQDKILVLSKNTETTTSDYANGKPDKRKMLLLLGQSDNTYKIICKSENAIPCIDFGGSMLGDPFIGTKINNGYFSIKKGIFGGPQHWQEIITFKYDKKNEKWYLYKKHFIGYKMNPSNDPNAQALIKAIDTITTKKYFGSISFNKYNIYNGGE